MQAQQAVEGLKVSGDKKAAAEQIKALYKTFTESDCTMVEVRAVSPSFADEWLWRMPPHERWSRCSWSLCLLVAHTPTRCTPLCSSSSIKAHIFSYWPQHKCAAGLGHPECLAVLS